jgi:hypothetical protein
VLMRVAKMLVAAGIVASALSVGVSDASALSGCSGSWTGTTWNTRCTSGTGHQRAWINCYIPALHTYYGGTVGVGSISQTWCVQGTPTGYMDWDLLP